MTCVNRILAVVLLASTLLQTLGAAETLQNKESQSTAAAPQTDSKPEVELLTDTEGIDFKPYMQAVYSAVRYRWLLAMPMPVKLGEQGRTVVKFHILQNGTVPADSVKMEISSNACPRNSLGLSLSYVSVFTTTAKPPSCDVARSPTPGKRRYRTS
jgi:hypothetical protein